MTPPAQPVSHRSRLVRILFATIASSLLALPVITLAQDDSRPASPTGTTATQILGTYQKPAGADEPVYTGGKWIEVSYGRPIKRGRDLWGNGADYGKMLNGGAPVWRAGANQTTRLKTEVALVINGKTIPPGEYSLFIDLKPGNWTFIVSNWPAQMRYEPNNTQALWGSYGYTADKDIVRAPMSLATLPMAVDQLTWQFTNVSNAGGSLTLMWDNMAASVPFSIGR